MSFLNYILSAIALGTTFLYGSVGEIITEKSGHLNLGIPGVMSFGAASGCLALQALYPYQASLSPVLIVIIGILAAFLGGALMGLIYCFLADTLHANQNVIGLTLTIFGVGLSKFMIHSINVSTDAAGNPVGAVAYLYASKYFRAPFSSMTNSAKYCGVMVFLGIIIAVVASFVLKRTRVGLHLRAVGENPATADAAGINVVRYQYLATCIGSGISGLGGLFYIVDYAGSQDAYLTLEALGWLSVALVIFVLWKPAVSIFGSFLFGALYIVSSYVHLSIAGMQLLKALPYAVTILVLILTSIRNNKENQPPASLGLPYFREDR